MFDVSNFPTDFGQWTHEQRVQKSYLSEEKIQLLNCRLQFDWAAPSRSPSVPWHVMYQELMHYLKWIAPHTWQFDGTHTTKLIQKNGASEHLIAWSKTQQVRYRRVQEKKKNGDDVTAHFINRGSIYSSLRFHCNECTFLVITYSIDYLRVSCVAPPFYSISYIRNTCTVLLPLSTNGSGIKSIVGAWMPSCACSRSDVLELLWRLLLWLCVSVTVDHPSGRHHGALMMLFDDPL